VKRQIIFVCLFMLFSFTILTAQTESSVSAGDTSWILTSSALVLLMTIPGLAIFYGGMVRKKNILSTFYYSFAAALIVSALWVVLQYTLAFGQDVGGLIGWSPDKLFFNQIGNHSIHPVAGTIPESVFSMYQMMFAIITVALISGAIVERMRFSAWIVFAVLWTLIIYSPLAHWVWGGGWLSTIGNFFGWTYNGKPLAVLDFAGGLVVHISSGISALVAVLYIGKRIGFEKNNILPHNIPMTFLGTGLLWFGWFGFNAGSALASNGLAGSAFVVTNTAAVFGAITWIVIEWITVKKPSIIGGASGLVAGLATITPASGFVDVKAAILIGILAAICSFVFVTRIKRVLKYDDSLDVFNIHGVGGTLGILLAGLLANPAVGGATGLLYGNPIQLLVQLMGALAGYVYAGLGTLLILLFINKVLRMPLKVTDTQEISGLDLVLHGEKDTNDER
jgi:Amt family ammonium transporter